MKKLSIMFVLCSMLFAGCVLFNGDELPSVDTASKVSYCIGRTSAFVAKTYMDKNNVDKSVRSVVFDVFMHVKEITPETNQTFYATWAPVITNQVDALVVNGKLREEFRPAVVYILTKASNGLDYIVTVKYPNITQHVELMKAINLGFSNGFIDGFDVNVANTTVDGDYMLEMSSSGTTETYIDIEALKYINR